MEIDKMKKQELIELCKDYPESEWNELKVPELKEYLKSKLGEKEPEKKLKRIDYVKKYRK